MTTDSFSPFFGAYNARHLNPEEVASQFVSSEKFRTLISLRHSLLIGPRGSGKTHLLKMLQPKALAAWDHSEADSTRKAVKFFGVFIAADVTWRAQVQERTRTLQPDLADKYARAVFILHLREALVSCLLQMTHDRPIKDKHSFQRVSLTPVLEGELVATIANSWGIIPRLNSLLSLRQCVVDTLSKFKLSENTSHVEVEILVNSVQPDVMSTVRQLIEAFNSLTGNFDARWALCFDELEIAPEIIQQELFECLRSTDRRVLFKLAISPFNAHTQLLNKATTAAPFNDYDPIPLWFTDIKESATFCRNMWDHLVQGTAAEGLPPWAILDHSKFHFADSSASGVSKYAKNGPWARAFTSLASIDPSFSDYLKRKNIRPTALDSLPGSVKDQVVRKVAPLVGFRNAYLKADDTDLRVNPRVKKRVLKTPPSDIFSGWEAICLATEGNPRWFNGLVSRLLIKWRSQGGLLPRTVQAREFTVASEKFLAWISAVPVPTSGLTGPLENGIRGLLDVLGSAFRNEVLGGKFSADPVLAFTVASDLPDSIKELLVSALNVGAIVSMSDRQVDFTLTNLAGHKFRLVHLLAPEYRLPLRTGEDRSLQLLINDQHLKSKGLQVNRFSRKVRPVSEIVLPRSKKQKDLF
jgi:hypothetical protein